MYGMSTNPTYPVLQAWLAFETAATCLPSHVAEEAVLLQFHRARHVQQCWVQRVKQNPPARSDRPVKPLCMLTGGMPTPLRLAMLKGLPVAASNTSGTASSSSAPYRNTVCYTQTPSGSTAVVGVKLDPPAKDGTLGNKYVTCKLPTDYHACRLLQLTDLKVFVAWLAVTF